MEGKRDQGKLYPGLGYHCYGLNSHNQTTMILVTVMV
jgi:hypothetical protein